MKIKNFIIIFIFLFILLIFLKIGCSAQIHFAFSNSFAIPIFSNLNEYYFQSLIIEDGFKISYFINDYFIIGYFLDITVGLLTLLNAYKTILWILFFPINISLGNPFPEIPPSIFIINTGIILGTKIISKSNFKIDGEIKFGFGILQTTENPNQFSFYSLKPEIILKFPLNKIFGIGILNSFTILLINRSFNKLVYYPSLGLYLYLGWEK